MKHQVRPIAPGDNAQVAKVIREVMTEFGCVGPGFSIEDPEVDDMYSNYQSDRHGFYVVEDIQTESIVLVGGYAPLTDGDPSICELRKMYGYATIRGKGLGKKLMELILIEAKADGFTQMYLETASSMVEAAGLYKRFGFTYIDAPMGHTGHSSCDDFMLKQL